MTKFSRNILEILFLHPYIYILVFLMAILLIAVILLFLFHKQFFRCLQKFWKKHGGTLTFKKESAISFSADSKNKRQVVIRNVDMKNSKIHSVTGAVTMEDVKMKNSYVGDIRSE